jgi:hypothetical protein
MEYTYDKTFRIGRRSDTLFKRINKSVRVWYEGNVQPGVQYNTEPKMTLSEDKKEMRVLVVMRETVKEID